jgi:hypothetical protein
MYDQWLAMRRLDRVSAQIVRWRISSIGLVVIALLLAACPLLTQAQRDPLNSAHRPGIDTRPSDYPTNIWITDTMQKVRQDSGTPGSAHWGMFYGTQNEFVDFQVHFHDNGSGTEHLSVTVGNFTQSAPTKYTISSNVLVYREAYMHVTGRVTSTADTYYGSEGYYPDILIPAVDPYFGQKTNAWPFNVKAGNNQSAWVDVLIPPAAPAGYYLGSVTVRDGSTTLATMPVILAVWQWPSAGFMPSTATLQSTSAAGWDNACIQFYGNYSACRDYPGAGGSSDQGVTNSMVEMATMMLDHRFSAPNPIYPPPPSRFNALETDYGPLLNGTAPTILHGAKLTTAILEPTDTTAYAQAWETEWERNGWTATPFAYSCDEPPSGCTWSTIRTNARSLHAAVPPMPALVTTDVVNANQNGVLNSIDILAPVINSLDPQDGGAQRSAYSAWLAGSMRPARRLWSYQSCMSAGTCTNGISGSAVTYPNYDVDGKPAANRAMEWMSYRNGVTGELYYLLNLAWATGDPWKSVYAFGGWGDGTLLYPGTSSRLGPNVTHPVFLPSVRLKHIRDGIQDYEYLSILNAKGQRALVTAEVNSWIKNSYTFETTGSGLSSARMALGMAMHTLTYPAPGSGTAPAQR